MLKKIIFSIGLSAFTSIGFANQSNVTLTVTPIDSDSWGYMYSYITINHKQDVGIGNGSKIKMSVGDEIDLTVFAMNTKLRVSPNCQHLRITTPGDHYLSFQLEPSWIVECKFK